MGIVIRQSFWNLLFNYGGVAIGYVNKILLFTAFLTREQFGLVELLLTFMVIGSEVSRLGLNKLIIRFFPYFRKDPTRQGAFVAFTAGYALIGMAAATLLLVVFQPFFVQMYEAESPLFVQYLYWTPLLVVIFSGYNYINAYAQAIMTTVVPGLIWQMVLRLLHTAIILWYAFGNQDFDQFVALYVLSHGVCFLLMAGYVLAQKQLGWSWQVKVLPRRFRKLMVGYSGFSTLTDATSVLLDKIDIAMIGLLIGEAEAGAYAVAYYIAILILMPARAMNAILIPLVSRRAQERNFEEIGALYKKSSLNNLIVGGLFYLGIVLCIDPFFELAPKHASGKWSAIILGAAMLFNIGTSINRIILINSRFFKFDFAANIVLLVLAITTNYLLIPPLGITGAAIATFVSISLINSVLTWYVYRKFRIQPFSRGTLVTLGLLTATGLVVYLIPMPFPPLIVIALRAVLAGTLFGWAVFLLKLSPELNGVVFTLLRRAKLIRS